MEIPTTPNLREFTFAQEVCNLCSCSLGGGGGGGGWEVLVHGLDGGVSPKP